MFSTDFVAIPREEVMASLLEEHLDLPSDQAVEGAITLCDILKKESREYFIHSDNLPETSRPMSKKMAKAYLSILESGLARGIIVTWANRLVEALRHIVETEECNCRN